jgi:hypothetical protein
MLEQSTSHIKLDHLSLFLYIFIGRNIPFINRVKYIGVIFDKKNTCRLHIVVVETKALKTFV